MADLYGAFFKSVLNPAWEAVLRGRPTLRYLAWLEKTQWRPFEELRAFQDADLRRLLAHAYANVPLYRRRFDDARVRPEDLRTAADLAQLPILTRHQASDADEARASTVPPLATIKKSTGGSTGRPLAFRYEPDSENWRNAMKLRGYRWTGYQPGRRTFYYWGRFHLKQTWQRRAKVWLDHALKREVYCDSTLRGEDEMLAAIAAIRRHRPETIVVYTSSGADLARFIVERSLRDWDDVPVICAAEKLYPQDRVNFVKAFGPQVFDTYGCREVMLVAHECELHDGLHVSMENLVVEVVVTEPDGRTRAARPGESGDVVVTDLHNLGMPFIRYANGDRAVQGPEEPCACGRALPRIAAVEGRISDTLKNRQGYPVGGMVWATTTTVIAHKIRHIQVVQHKDLSLTVRIVPSREWDDAGAVHIRGALAPYLPGIPIDITLVDDIPLAPNGKRQVVIVE